MDRLENIMKNLEGNPSLVTQEDYDEIEAISENIVKFLDENPDVDRRSFMMGFTLANISAIVGMLKTTTEELQYESDLLLKEISEPGSNIKEVITDDSFELEEGENPWPLRSRET